MRNKKVLSLCLCAFALLTIISLLIPGALVPYQDTLPEMFKMIYWILTGVMLSCIGIIFLITLISLFINKYGAIKIAELFALLSFTMSFSVAVIFSVTEYTLALGYIAVAVVTFILCMISKIGSWFEAWGDVRYRKRMGIGFPKVQNTQPYSNLPYDDYSSQGYKGQYNEAFEQTQGVYNGYSPTNFGGQYGGDYNENMTNQETYNIYKPTLQEENQFVPNTDQDYQTADSNELDLARELNTDDNYVPFDIEKANAEATQLDPQGDNEFQKRIYDKYMKIKKPTIKFKR